MQVYSEIMESDSDSPPSGDSPNEQKLEKGSPHNETDLVQQLMNEQEEILPSIFSDRSQQVEGGEESSSAAEMNPQSNDEEEEMKEDDDANEGNLIYDEGSSMNPIPSLFPKRKMISSLVGEYSSASSHHLHPSIEQKIATMRNAATQLRSFLSHLINDSSLIQWKRELTNISQPLLSSILESIFQAIQLQQEQQLQSSNLSDVPLDQPIESQTTIHLFLEQMQALRVNIDAISIILQEELPLTFDSTNFNNFFTSLDYFIVLVTEHLPHSPPQLINTNILTQQQQQQQHPQPPPSQPPPQAPQANHQQHQAQPLRGAGVPLANVNPAARIAMTYQMSFDMRGFHHIQNSLSLVIQQVDLILNGLLLISAACILYFVYKFDVSFSVPSSANISTNKCPSQTIQDDRFIDALKFLIHHKSSKLFVNNLVIFFVCLATIIIRRLWRHYNGEFTNEHRKEVKANFGRFLPLKHLVIMKILDQSVWTNEFSLFIFATVFVQTAISRCFTHISESSVKLRLDGLQTDSADNEADRKAINNHRKFNRILGIWNLSTLVICLVVFQSAQTSVLCRLVYGLVVGLIINVKFERSCSKLLEYQGLHYYVNCNYDVILEPTQKIEIFFDSIAALVKSVWLAYIISLYALHSSMDTLLSFGVLYYIIIALAAFLKRVKLLIHTQKSASYFEVNIDAILSKRAVTEANKEDICSICHEELLVARQLQECHHAFHLKCLFQWIKTNPNPSCPICRVEIRNTASLGLHLHQPNQGGRPNPQQPQQPVVPPNQQPQMQFHTQPMNILQFFAQQQQGAANAR